MEGNAGESSAASHVSGYSAWLDETVNRPSAAAESTDETVHEAPDSVGAGDGHAPLGRCRIGHCLEMPHLAFVDWQAPTADGERSGLFTVNLTRAMTLAVESHPTHSRMRRINVTCGTEHVASIDALREATTALHTDMWEALSAARANYASHARQYRKARAARLASGQPSSSGALSDERTAERSQNNADAARAAAQGAANVAPTPESVDHQPAAQRISGTTKAILVGLFGYILLTAAGLGAYSLYTNASPVAATSVSAPPDPSNGGATDDGARAVSDDSTESAPSQTEPQESGASGQWTPE